MSTSVSSLWQYISCIIYPLFSVFPLCTLFFRLNAGDIDTQKEFYTDPERWLDSRYSASQTNLPTHIVMFDALVKVLYVL